ncbi:hypothetical protein C0991_011833 [Blastosporella zonata]|nr:hypothetical protein C0991_011833 [Blastosporella zonata]
MGKPAESPVSTNSLTVHDNRTGKVYNVPIEDNSVAATAFKAMSAPRASGEREENETEKGLRVSDKGFLNTAVMRSTITFIDGEAGVLRYRGYPIEQLALQSSHLETAYLLMYGSLPTAPQLVEFQNEVMHHGTVHADAEQFCRSFRYDAHPMAILTSAFAYLGSYYGEGNPSLQGQNIYTRGDKASLELMDKQIYRLIGKATTLAAMAYRVRQGRDFVTPPTGLSYTGSFLYQMDHLGEENYVPNPVLEKALDVLFLLHADHELNASATTVLQTGSSLVDPYSAIAAGCASLYGPLHGGANEAVIRMLISIGKPQNVPAFLEAVKKREKVLSGFGHRVYKTSDPRSFIVRKTADEVFKITGKDELLETAMALHEAAMKDEYFIKRKLAPNVDFWIPPRLLPRAVRCAASGRMVGSLAAGMAPMMLQEGGVKIWRPRQIYVGEGKRDYVPLEEREAVEGPKVTPSKVIHSGCEQPPKPFILVSTACSLPSFLYNPPTASLHRSKMFSTLISLALLAAPVLADFAVNTPAFTQCQKSTISWAPTTGPYNVIVVAASDPCGDAIADLGDQTSTTVSWTAAIPAGVKVQISVEDANGDEAWSGDITVGTSSDASCVPAALIKELGVSSSSSSSSAAASSSTKATSSTTQAASGTTIVVTPTTTVLGAAATSADDSTPSAVGAAAANPLLGNGASSARQSTPLVLLGALAAVLAFSL